MPHEPMAYKNIPMPSFSKKELEGIRRFITGIQSKFLSVNENGQVEACTGCLTHMLMESDASQEEHYNRDLPAFLAGAETAFSLFSMYLVDADPKTRKAFDKFMINKLIEPDTQE